jgi:hypothetical protein
MTPANIPKSGHRRPKPRGHQPCACPRGRRVLCDKVRGRGGVVRGVMVVWVKSLALERTRGREICWLLEEVASAVACCIHRPPSKATRQARFSLLATNNPCVQRLLFMHSYTSTVIFSFCWALAKPTSLCHSRPCHKYQAPSQTMTIITTYPPGLTSTHSSTPNTTGRPKTLATFACPQPKGAAP